MARTRSERAAKRAKVADQDPADTSATPSASRPRTRSEVKGSRKESGKSMEGSSAIPKGHGVDSETSQNVDALVVEPESSGKADADPDVPDPSPDDPLPEDEDQWVDEPDEPSKVGRIEINKFVIIYYYVFFLKDKKPSHVRSKFGTEERVAKRMDKANVRFYKEKGASEQSYLYRQGRALPADVELKFYSQRHFSVIDLEKKLTTSLSIMSKFCIITLNYI